MYRIRRRTPIWKTKSIGLAYYELNEDVEVSIDYLDKNGLRLFPYVYIFRCKNKDKYPVQIIKGVKLIIVPIKDLEITKKLNLL